MNLDPNQQGILVGLVESGSPADQSGLRGSDRAVNLEGQTVMIGGDVITSVDGKGVATLDDLRNLIGSYQPGSVIKLSILRGGNSMDVPVTLVERPASVP
jgi:S1-C subfamily serine protease